MSKRVVFEVDKYDLVEMSDSEIMKVKMYIVSEGNNAHNMPISWEAIQKAKPTLIGKPIVAKYNKWSSDLMGHESDEIPIGVVLTEENLFEEEIDGKRWLGAYGDIWMRYTQDISGVLIRDMVKNLSMEILVAEESDVGDIMAFAFTGITLIGSDKTPAIKDAKIEVLTFEAVKDEIEKRVFSLENDASTQSLLSDSDMDKLADKIYGKIKEKEGNIMEKKFELSHEDIRRAIDLKINTEDGYEYWIRAVYEDYFIMEDNNEVDEYYKVKYQIVDDEVKVNMEDKEVVKMKWVPEEDSKEEKMTSDAYAENSAIEQNQDAVAKEQMEQAKEQNAPEMMEIEKSKYEYYIKLEEDFKVLEAENKAIKEDKEAYMAEFERLQKFEADYNLTKFKAEVEATFADVEDIPLDEINKLREFANEFTLETINDWKNQVFAKAYTYSKGIKKENSYIKMDIISSNVEDEKKNKKGLWD